MQIFNKDLQMFELLMDLFQESEIDMVTHKYFSIIHD